VSSGALPPYGDPLSVPFWEAARRHELVVQKCSNCGIARIVPRPFCVSCNADTVSWVKASGLGTIYSMTTVHRSVSPTFPTPYTNAIVELDEGARILTNIVDGLGCRIGDRVRITWHARDPAPPLPMFTPATGKH
jgi:uncharacterized protein